MSKFFDSLPFSIFMSILSLHEMIMYTHALFSCSPYLFARSIDCSSTMTLPPHQTAEAIRGRSVCMDEEPPLTCYMQIFPRNLNCTYDLLLSHSAFEFALKAHRGTGAVGGGKIGKRRILRLLFRGVMRHR